MPVDIAAATAPARSAELAIAAATAAAVAEFDAMSSARYFELALRSARPSQRLRGSSSGIRTSAGGKLSSGPRRRQSRSARPVPQAGGMPIWGMDTTMIATLDKQINELDRV